MNTIKEFVNRKEKENTRLYYELTLNKFFDCIKTNPDNYFKSKRDYEADVIKFVATLRNYAPITQKTYISVIKRFFYLNDIDFKPKFWELEVRDKIEKGGYALTLDRKPTNTELKKILSYGDLKARALFTLLATSGLRISELLKVTLDDIDLDSKPALIKIKSTYVKGARRSRWGFMSDEAKELLKEWLTPNKSGVTERDKYVIEMKKQMRGVTKKSWDTDKLFPIGKSGVTRLWHRLIKNAELDKKYSETGRYEIHVHSLRKFFISQLKTEIPEVIVEAWAGHKKYLAEAYARYDIEEQKQFYLKGMHTLTIFRTTPDLTETNKEIGQLKSDNDKFKELVERMQMKMDILEQKYELEKIKNGNK